MLLPTQLPTKADFEFTHNVLFFQDLARFSRAAHAIWCPFHILFVETVLIYSLSLDFKKIIIIMSAKFCPF